MIPVKIINIRLLWSGCFNKIRAIADSIPTNGKITYLKFCFLFLTQESHAEKYIIKPNLSISTGCNVKGPIFIQRSAPPCPQPSPGINTVAVKSKEPKKIKKAYLRQNYNLFLKQNTYQLILVPILELTDFLK